MTLALDSGRSIAPRTERPDDREIHVWLLYQQEANDPALHEIYRAWLTDDERLRGARFRLQKHRVQFLLTRALIRAVLSRYSGIDPRWWRFGATKYGRPYIVEPNGLSTPSFSIAHTEGLIVCACTNSARVGIDAEQVRSDHHVGLDIAARYFSTSEVAELRGAAQHQAERFFSYWTLKESYIKAIGTGLSTPLDRFSFRLGEAGRIGLSFHECLNDSPENWRFWLMRPATSHLLAICVERTLPHAQQIVARRIVPLALEEVVVCEMIAQTPPATASIRDGSPHG